MIGLDFEIPDFGWTVHFHFAASCKDTGEIIGQLRSLGCPASIVEKATALMSECLPDKGITYSNGKRRESVVVIVRTTSAAEFQNSLQHEIRHFIDDIILTTRYYDKEEIAYLTGETNRAIFPYVRGFLCDECRRRRIS